MPTPPPDQTTRLDQDPHLGRRRALDQPHRPELDQPHPPPPTSHPGPITTAAAQPATRSDDRDDHDWPDDPEGLELRVHDTEPADDHDILGEHIQHTDTRWSLELDNPYLWLPEGSG